MIGVYYPYLEGAKKWEELKYSLRSLDRFFKEDFEVWIVGDLPSWIKNVRHIPHKKTERIISSATYDAVSKLMQYIDNKDSPERFVRMYDDIYFIGDRKLADLEVTRYLFSYEELLSGVCRSGSLIWQDQVRKSVEAARQLGYPGYLTETHCPEVFEKQKMLKVFELFGPLENRLLTSTLYFNVFPFDRLLKDRKTERALFYGHENDFSYGNLSVSQLDQILKGKYFMNHNDLGLDNNLKKYISKMFPKKSRFEK